VDFLEFPYSWFWGCCPYYWKTDLYQKFIYLSYWGQHRGLPKPKANAEFMPVSGLKPKAKLKKVYVDYAVNLQAGNGFVSTPVKFSWDFFFHRISTIFFKANFLFEDFLGTTWNGRSIPGAVLESIKAGRFHRT